MSKNYSCSVTHVYAKKITQKFKYSFYTNDNTKNQIYKNDKYIMSYRWTFYAHTETLFSRVTTYMPSSNFLTFNTNKDRQLVPLDSVSWYEFLKYPAPDTASEEHGGSRRVLKRLYRNTISAWGRPHWHHHLTMTSLFSYSSCRNFYWRRFLWTYEIKSRCRHG
jgi:hypothetical protein